MSGLAPAVPPPLRFHEGRARGGSTPKRSNARLDTEQRLQHAANVAIEVDLVSLQFPADRGRRDGLPVHLCKGAVGDLDLDVVGSRQRYCNTAREHPVRKRTLCDLTDFRLLWERALLKCATMISLLTVFSRIPDHRVRLRAAAVIVDGLNPDLIGHVCGRPRHNKLGNIGHILCGPIPVRVQLSPLDSVLQTRPVGLKTCQRLCGGKKKLGKKLACLLLPVFT